MSEKLRLKWNDFQENISTAFANLRGNNDFSDVTLACEDGQQFEAHKVILVASSPFFHRLLKTNMHTHPLIYMRGIKSEDLSAIIDFLYCGEANIFQENLESFLAIAEELKLKGLMRQRDATEEKFQESYTSPVPMPARMKPAIKQDQNQPTNSKSICTDQQLLNVDNDFEQREGMSKYVSGNLHLQELDQQVKSMMENSQNMIASGNRLIRAKICKVCEKEGENKAIRDHIEAHHLEGISLPCNACEKTFRSRTSLRLHKYKTNIDMMYCSGVGIL